jgi:hypothetical protein
MQSSRAVTLNFPTTPIRTVVKHRRGAMSCAIDKLEGGGNNGSPPHPPPLCAIQIIDKFPLPREVKEDIVLVPLFR